MCFPGVRRNDAIDIIVIFLCCGDDQSRARKWRQTTTYKEKSEEKRERYFALICEIGRGSGTTGSQKLHGHDLNESLSCSPNSAA